MQRKPLHCKHGNTAVCLPELAVHAHVAASAPSGPWAQKGIFHAQDGHLHLPD